MTRKFDEAVVSGTELSDQDLEPSDLFTHLVGKIGPQTAALGTFGLGAIKELVRQRVGLVEATRSNKGLRLLEGWAKLRRG
ncbi:MAG: hypothetical protein QOE83_26 [Actinomycetota bacterium]|jgi:hypothetical protein|nr:hypothetical protein [Actinomycetota bacterium]